MRSASRRIAWSASGTLTWRRRAAARRWLAPEVVQTSAMDCGPAALKCLLDGFGLPASYGRLREACQTDVDGTSIDTLEDLANDIGLVAEQVLLPVDHVLASAADVLPGIVVVRQPGGLLHFVVAWRRHGPVVQFMDPATGPPMAAHAGVRRRAVRAHDAGPGRRVADVDGVGDVPRRAAGARARHAGSAGASSTLSPRGVRTQGWQPMAALDATLRMVAALRQPGGFSRARRRAHAEAIWEQARAAAEPTDIVPADYWTVRRAPPATATSR